MLCSVTDLRLQLLDVQHNQDLIRSLYGLLMLLPQSEAFKLLRFRLDCIPQYQLLAMKEKFVPMTATISPTLCFTVSSSFGKGCGVGSYCKTQLKSVYQRTLYRVIFFTLFIFIQSVFVFMMGIIEQWLMYQSRFSYLAWGDKKSYIFSSHWMNVVLDE